MLNSVVVLNLYPLVKTFIEIVSVFINSGLQRVKCGIINLRPDDFPVEMCLKLKTMIFFSKKVQLQVFEERKLTLSKLS